MVSKTKTSRHLGFTMGLFWPSIIFLAPKIIILEYVMACSGTTARQYLTNLFNQNLCAQKSLSGSINVNQNRG